MPTRLLILGLGDTVIGAALIFGSPTRTSSPAYAQIKALRPVTTWGAVLLTIGLLLLAGLLLHQHTAPQVNRRVEAVTGILGAAWCTFWATTLISTALDDVRVGYTGGALWLFFGAVPHLALALGREG